MASTTRFSEAPLIDLLFKEAHKFDFFQAVRLLEWIYRERAAGDESAMRFAVGKDHPPGLEVARFRALTALRFPASAVAELHESTSEGRETPPEMVVSFMGLTGPQGVLPRHYTELLMERVRLRDTTLRDFLDLFNHRSVSLMYRAWEKYRAPFAFERARLDTTSPDRFTECLRSLVGIGTGRLQNRLSVSDDVLLFYSGYFSHRPRNAVSLQRLLGDYFQLPVSVEQFCGHWLYIAPDERTIFPGRTCPAGQYCRLGESAVIGERVWDTRSKFRLQIGSLSYTEFSRLMPIGDKLRPLCELTRLYVGPELAFDVQPVLRADQVPQCRLGGEQATGSRLGWNTWIRSQPFAHDADDALFLLNEQR